MTHGKSREVGQCPFWRCCVSLRGEGMGHRLPHPPGSVSGECNKNVTSHIFQSCESLGKKQFSRLESDIYGYNVTQGDCWRAQGLSQPGWAGIPALLCASCDGSSCDLPTQGSHWGLGIRMLFLRGCCAEYRCMKVSDCWH